MQADCFVTHIFRRDALHLSYPSLPPNHQEHPDLQGRLHYPSHSIHLRRLNMYLNQVIRHLCKDFARVYWETDEHIFLYYVCGPSVSTIVVLTFCSLMNYQTYNCWATGSIFILEHLPSFLAYPLALFV